MTVKLQKDIAEAEAECTRKGVQSKANAKTLDKMKKDVVKDGEWCAAIVEDGVMNLNHQCWMLKELTSFVISVNSAAEKVKLEAEVAKIQGELKALEDEAGEAYVRRQEREAAVEANKSELEVARAEVSPWPRGRLMGDRI